LLKKYTCLRNLRIRPETGRASLMELPLQVLIAVLPSTMRQWLFRADLSGHGGTDPAAAMLFQRAIPPTSGQKKGAAPPHAVQIGVTHD
jgi:hypothetical protein